MAIQQATAIDATLEELYQSVEDLCSHGMAEKVYQALKLLVETYVQECVQQFLGESLDKLIFMKKMNDCWSGHCRQMIMVRSIFLFLDRTYVLQHPSVMSIWELGLDTFRRCILTNALGNSSYFEYAIRYYFVGYLTVQNPDAEYIFSKFLNYFQCKHVRWTVY